MERIKVIELDSVDSTNRYLHDYDGEEGELMTVVVSRNQTAGRGHGDNKWESEDGKNLTFKTGGVDGCDCEEVLQLIEQGKIDTTPLITHRFPLSRIEEAYRIFENKEDGVIKIAIYNDNV